MKVISCVKESSSHLLLKDKISPMERNPYLHLNSWWKIIRKVGGGKIFW
jgi:hypothetical protein